jgi:hypothetical protein
MVETMLSRRINFVERGGRTLESLLCRTESIVYEVRCGQCQREGWWTRVYIREKGKSGYEWVSKREQTGERDKCLAKSRRKSPLKVSEKAEQEKGESREGRKGGRMPRKWDRRGNMEGRGTNTNQKGDRKDGGSESQKITDNPEKEMLEERKRGEGLQEEGSEWNEASPSKWECDQTGGWLR